MKELSKNEKIILTIAAILLFGGKLFYWISVFTSNQILVVISIALKAVFYVIWISLVAKASKSGAIFLFICAIVELFIMFLLF